MEGNQQRQEVAQIRTWVFTIQQVGGDKNKSPYENPDRQSGNTNYKDMG